MFTINQKVRITCKDNLINNQTGEIIGVFTKEEFYVEDVDDVPVIYLVKLDRVKDRIPLPMFFQDKHLSPIILKHSKLNGGDIDRFLNDYKCDK